MSVAVYMENADQSEFEAEFCIPVASERFFVQYWQKAIDELSLKRLQNGIYLRREALPEILAELQSLKNWADTEPDFIKNKAEQDYMTMRIHTLLVKLPEIWKMYPDAILWMG